MNKSIRQSKKELWMSRIMACRQSGLPDVRWCRENGIHPSFLYYWISKFRNEAPEVITEGEHPEAPYQQDVVPLHIIEDKPHKNEMTPTAAITLHMGAITLDIHNGAHEETIEMTIKALRKLC